MTAASLFGYDKSEVINKKVNNIMPTLFARNHDDFLKSIHKIIIIKDFSKQTKLYY